MKTSRDDLLASTTADPVLTFNYIMMDLGVSMATFYRDARRELPVVQLSPRRLGVRRSDYLAWKAGRVIAPKAA